MLGSDVMNYKVEIPEFEGPLDLLLHLIKQDDIDIFDISIDRITKQYLDYLNLMEELNLDIASEYLVMASELIEMKSNLLLPTQHSDEDDDYMEDPKEKLIQRLLEYEKYKQVTKTFHKLEEIRKEVYTRDTNELLDYNIEEEIDYGVNLDDLLAAFQNFINKQELDKPLNTKIEKKEYSINKRCFEIKELIKKNKKTTFKDLFTIPTREYVVVTFLAVLSLVKHHEISIKQDNNFNNIIIEEYK